ncbi:toll/interleukin-1 receptor domain-containing protein [Mucilaginibacter sp.]|uniref:toll/interleukin-1 receptor domain-containing protein n=1 Tax=Mucilaginibacter sp. TaxID=1882438 RepID=UPI003266FE76
MEEAIVISATERVPAEWVDDFVKEVDREDFKVKKIVAEDMGLMAAIEWTIPTLVVAYLLKPFFQSFLDEAGKDAYAHAKVQLKKFLAKNKAIKIRLMAATQSIHKLSKTYDQSLSVSIKARIHERLTVTVLFGENVPDEEGSQMMDGMFQILEMLYEQCQKESPETEEASKGFSHNNVYLVANNDTKQWEILTNQQMTAKYRNIVTLDDLNEAKNKESNKPESQPVTMTEVFISYSWDTPEHEQKVVDLTNHLRSNGFNATIDKMISQEKTAINFVRMMHEALLLHPKVIVILSKGYKQKAESFKGGVGEEYEILINDIKTNERKYILASFEGRGDDIVPIGLKGRDIVDLSQPDEEKRLLEKLLDHQRYQFVEVGDKKPELSTIAPQPFTTAGIKVPIEILPPRVTPTGNAGYTGDQYRDVELVMNIEFKNVSSKPVTEFGGQIKINKFIVPDYRDHTIEGDMVLLDVSVARKVFPGQTTMGKQWQFELNRGNIQRVIDTEIIVTVYTEEGNAEAKFNFKDVVFLKPPNKHWMDAQPLTLNLFVG